MATHPSARRLGAASLLTGAAALLALLGSSAASAPAAAQHTGGSQPMATRPPAEASQFDFLLGQWDLVVEPQVSSLAARVHGVPKLMGTWKAWRALDGWGIEDEFRIVDESGNPRALTLFVRVYDAGARRWRVSATDAYTAATSQSLATWRETGMEASAAAPSTDAAGRTYAGRSRITDVTPTSFTYVQERSYDGGRGWETTLRILATRVAASAPR
ncbi:MAG TPA: hypothetical protein VLH75_20040 [Longimicrobiales bacterium]|nr:hypothetical protein [Longimicrobiales bacterium]